MTYTLKVDEAQLHLMTFAIACCVVRDKKSIEHIAKQYKLKDAISKLFVLAEMCSIARESANENFVYDMTPINE